MKTLLILPAIAGIALIVAGCGGRVVEQGPQPADNEMCQVCHIDFMPEDLTAVHASNGVGCVNCHGASTNHMHNEENVIPPDVMFERGDINRLCLVCHEPLPFDHEVMEIGASAQGEVCVDCHGRHKVANPRRRWNKKTRELIR